MTQADPVTARSDVGGTPAGCRTRTPRRTRLRGPGKHRRRAALRGDADQERVLFTSAKRGAPSSRATRAPLAVKLIA